MSENICPFCHADNNCMAHSGAPCWCNQVTVPQELLDLLPEKNKGHACICLSCLQAFHENPRMFADTRRNQEHPR